MKIILRDDLENLDVSHISTMNYTKVERLKSLAVYFHSHKCVSELMKINKNCEWRAYHFQTAILSDNVRFFKDHISTFRVYDRYTRQSLLQLANERSSTEIKSLLKELEVPNGTSRKLPALAKYHQRLMSFRSSYQGLQCMWEMESYEYGNVIQWFPRETLEDLLEHVICRFAIDLADI